MRTPLFSVLAVMAACVASGKPAADLQVTAVRFWTLGDVTRIAIEANGDFTFKRDRLNNPDRLFFDIIDARPNVGGVRFSTRQVNDRLLKQIRVAETNPGRTRVVLDLSGPVDYTVSKLENPDRLMIELRSPGGAKKAEPVTPITSSLPAPVAAPFVAQVAVTPATLPDVPMVIPAASSNSSSLPPAATTALGKPTRPDTGATLVVAPPSVPVALDPGVARAGAAVAIPTGKPAPEGATAARRSTADGSRSLIRALGLKINRVVIDAGHGGHDVGSTGVTGLLEKDLVLDVALRLGKLIELRLGAEVIYTRQDDVYVALEERTAIANRNHADLFLSIHANSSPIKAVAGVETFYLNFTSSADALDVASRENASSQKSVFELRDIIQSISLHDKIEESKEFAIDVQRSMQANAVHYISTAKDRGIKKAPFVVLIGAQMPSVLTEIGFISNPKEEGLLKRPEHRQQIAEALFKGLSRYSDSLSHIQVASQIADRELAAK
jgi:N-acetylmuramoyl-L-alanine amidase